jgi:hypothetical protein
MKEHAYIQIKHPGNSIVCLGSRYKANEEGISRVPCLPGAFSDVTLCTLSTKTFCTTMAPPNADSLLCLVIIHIFPL